MKPNDVDDHRIPKETVLVITLLFNALVWLFLTMQENGIGLPTGWTAFNEVSDLLQQIMLALLFTRDKP